MPRPDLNLLVTLDVLLAEGSVARAGHLVEAAEAVLRPAAALDLERLERSFTIRARDGFMEIFGAALIARVSREAPGVQLRFVPKPDKDSGPLRDGSVDLEIGVVGSATGPEVRAQALMRDRFVGVVRKGHPLGDGEITPENYAAGRHVVVALWLFDRGPIDEALKVLGLERRIVTFVSSFSDALALARATDLIATVPERHTTPLRDSLHCFPLPLPVPDFTVSLLWHPRLDADPAHRWLRGCVRDACAG
jgi:DNA-binding transcriptional LysR family regulator